MSDLIPVIGKPPKPKTIDWDDVKHGLFVGMQGGAAQVLLGTEPFSTILTQTSGFMIYVPAAPLLRIGIHPGTPFNFSILVDEGSCSLVFSKVEPLKEEKEEEENE